MLTGRYMSLAFRTARTFWLKRTVRWSAVRPAPAPAGDSLLVSQRAPRFQGFYQRENKQSNIITLHRITSAKTPRPSPPQMCRVRYGARRATVRLLADQLHIPLNVRHQRWQSATNSVIELFTLGKKITND